MLPFLKQVAQHYYERYGSEISQLCFVFPNKRATLFFRRYLGGIVGKPILSPRLSTIRDFILELSPLKIQDRTALLFELYRCYQEIHPSPLSFDEFLFWGEIILSDFDEADRYLVDIKQLYSNLLDYRQLEGDYSFLSENQIEAIQSFWQSFEVADANKDGCQERFLDFWRTLYPLYTDLQLRLSAEGYAYEGMIHRQLAERFKNEEADSLSSSLAKQFGRCKQFVFVGLFALSPAEAAILTRLQKMNMAAFCWDYDLPIVQNKHPQIERIIQDNINRFGGGEDWHCRKDDIANADTKPTMPEIELLSCDTDVAQAKLLPLLLEKFWQEGYSEEKAIETAIVLPDSKMLMPCLGTVSSVSKHVNVTMGYPLSQTNIVQWANKWMEMQIGQRLYDGEAHIQVSLALDLLGSSLPNSLLSAEILELRQELLDNKRFFYPCSQMQCDEIGTLLFAPVSTGKDLLERLHQILEHFARAFSQELEGIEKGATEELTSDGSKTDEESLCQEEKEETGELASQDPAQMRLSLEYIYHYEQQLKTLLSLLSNYAYDLETRSAQQLLKGLLSSVKLAFEGEPLLGLQIMGLLETRSLEFENLIVLSASEGSLPRLRIDTTLIPYTLRRGYGLPIGELQDAIQAYHFYRLVGHSKKLCLLYNASGKKSGAGEESRYIRQLEILYRQPIRRVEIVVDGKKAPAAPRQITKTAEVMQILSRYLSHCKAEDLPEGYKLSKLSASAINRYVECPLSFYYQYVLLLKEDKELEPLMEASDFGSVMHNSLELLYTPFLNRVVQKEDLNVLLGKGNQEIERCVRSVYTEQYLNAKKAIKLSGLDLLYCRMIAHYIRRLFEHDIKLCPFTYLHSEFMTYGRIELSNGQSVELKGTIDRVDIIEREGKSFLRVLDYKTGTVKTKLSSWDYLFNPLKASESKTLAQTLLYCYLLDYELNAKGQAAQHPIQPTVYAMRELFKKCDKPEDFGIVSIEKEAITDYKSIEEEYLQRLRGCLDELFDPTIPFSETLVSGFKCPCNYCQFDSICGKS